MMRPRMRNEFDSYDDSREKSSTTRKLSLCALMSIIVCLGYYFLNAKTPEATECAVCDTCPGEKLSSSDPVDLVFTIKIISDLDKRSKVEGGKYTQWKSFLKSATVTRDAVSQTYSVAWDHTTELTSMHSYKGRGMELSELIRFNGRLLAFDDVTGIVYEIDEDTHETFPWVILSDGNGRHNKGFKCEWAAVKGNLLYVGSLGKEWTDPKTAKIINSNPQWVKTITPSGHVQNLDWSTQYNKMREATGTSDPGYMVFESANWHEGLDKWVFLPRRMSSEPYDEDEDERRAANTMILANSDFSSIEVRKDIGPFSNTHGFSSFKMVPGFPEEFVALKSEEDGDKIATYITVLDMNGNVLMEEQLIEENKYEGLEIIF